MSNDCPQRETMVNGGPISDDTYPTHSIFDITGERKQYPGTVPVMGANSGLPSTVLVLSMLHFVRSLHMDGTGYADTWLKELGSRPLTQSVKKSRAHAPSQAGSSPVTPNQGGAKDGRA